MIMIRPGKRIAFTYKNYRGEMSHRTVTIIGVDYGATEWRPEPGFLMSALDEKKAQERKFAMCDMSDLREVD